MKLRTVALAACLVALTPAFGAVIGHNTPAEAITAARIATLPADQRSAWQDYLARSEAQRVADKAALAAERVGLAIVPELPKEGIHDHSMPLDKDAAWYAGPEARHVADNIVSFQTPAGGWGKNHDRNGPLRLKGQAYVPNNLSQFLGANDYDTPKEPDWNYVGTFDNNATTTELRFLALVQKAVPGKDGDAYRAAFVKGLNYLFAAQFPNGGWPQVWPLEGGYHDAITYNDDAVTLAAEVMTAVAGNQDNDYAFVPAALRANAAKSAAHALDIILTTQVVSGGRPAIWGQQHDALTLQPCSARNFEPPVMASDESADLLDYLMSLPNPSPRLQQSIHAGIGFLQAVTITNITITSKNDSDGRLTVIKEGSKPLWGRYYDQATGKAIFAERDQSIRDSMNELSKERRNGYNWYVTSPEKALKAYERWSKTYPLKK